jgi:hypothetical protein
LLGWGYLHRWCWTASVTKVTLVSTPAEKRFIMPM